jgi:hypothetical protein
MFSLVGYPIIDPKPIRQLLPISDFPNTELNPSSRTSLPSIALLDRKLPALFLVTIGKSPIPSICLR